MGGHNHMFGFYPEQGSLMEDWPAVDRGQWRRVQLARLIIDYAGGRIEQMAFNADGQVVDFGLPVKQLEAIIRSGKPFQTSGCPGSDDTEISACNRPYGDSTPSDILSFPFALNAADIDIVQRQMAGENARSL
jgi:biotin synthase-related radical SAM superfamily protein